MSIGYRKYTSYKQYLRHQSLKLKIGSRKKIKKFMFSSLNRFVPGYKKRINHFKKYVKGKRVLCLGARLGHEVVAFRELGFKETIGIDINTSEENPYVVKGDFHKMEEIFSDNSFDTVYSNSIDHVFDVRVFSKEINRVLCAKGRLIFELDHFLKVKKRGNRKKILKDPTKYESVIFGNITDIKREFKEFKFIKKFVSICPVFLVLIFEKRN